MLSANTQQLLTYNAQYDVWHAPTLWMSDETFRRYVAPWLEGIAEPTQEQLYYAVGRCRRVDYWMRCGDPEVHFCMPPLRNEVMVSHYDSAQK
jgi:hypothetical protein